MCDESQDACNFLVDLVEMAKVNYQSVRQENRRIVLIRSMFERTKRRRRMVESALHSLLSRRMRLIKLAMALVLVAFVGKNAVTPSASSFMPSAFAKCWLMEHYLPNIL